MSIRTKRWVECDDCGKKTKDEKTAKKKGWGRRIGLMFRVDHVCHLCPECLEGYDFFPGKDWQTRA